MKWFVGHLPLLFFAHNIAYNVVEKREEIKKGFLINNIAGIKCGPCRTRTYDPLIMSQLL